MPSTEQGRPDGRQLRWDRHNQERRRQILRAAIAVVHEGEPGAEVHAQQIAERAGLSRSVLYRHFADRADLDRAVRAEIVDDLAARLLPTVGLDGTASAIIERIVATYVDWTVEHPALHRFAVQDAAAAGAGPVQAGLDRIAAQVAQVVTTAVELLGLELTAHQRAAVDPLVFGLVGSAHSSVRRWMARPERAPDAEVFIGLVRDSIWFAVAGHLHALGLDLDPDQPLDQLLAKVTRDADD